MTRPYPAVRVTRRPETPGGRDRHHVYVHHAGAWHHVYGPGPAHHAMALAETLTRPLPVASLAALRSTP